MTYRYAITFDAPVSFVFRWCTDYSDKDAQLEGETYQRKVLKRSRHRVVYEDVQEGPDGWFWARHDVALDPPNHWHSESVGNYRDYSLDYRLRALPDGRTEMRFVGKRQPALLGGPNPTARAFARSMDTGWQKFRRQLEKEYRASLGRRRRPPARRARP